MWKWGTIKALFPSLVVKIQHVQYIGMHLVHYKYPIKVSCCYFKHSTGKKIINRALTIIFPFSYSERKWVLLAGCKVFLSFLLYTYNPSFKHQRFLLSASLEILMLSQLHMHSVFFKPSANSKTAVKILL